MLGMSFNTVFCLWSTSSSCIQGSWIFKGSSKKTALPERTQCAKKWLKCAIDSHCIRWHVLLEWLRSFEGLQSQITRWTSLQHYFIILCFDPSAGNHKKGGDINLILMEGKVHSVGFTCGWWFEADLGDALNRVFHWAWCCCAAVRSENVFVLNPVTP